MFTVAVFFSKTKPLSLFKPVMVLPNHVYALATSGTDIAKTLPLQYGAALVLLLLAAGMNVAAIVLRDRLRRNMS